MILVETFPRSYRDAYATIRHACLGASTVALQAGHFILYYDRSSGEVIPCVAPLIVGPHHVPLRTMLGDFPVLSWRMGLRILRELPADRRLALILVNDWQYCRGSADRMAFYEQCGDLPTIFASELEAGGITFLTPAAVSGDRNLFFSEQRLRNQYRRRLRTMIANGKLPRGFSVEVSDDGVTCSVDDLVGRRQEIYCSGKGANCTAEVAELVAQVSSLSACDVFVNIFPSVCREYVRSGTELSLRLLHPSVRTVINLALPATDIRAEEDFWQGAFLSVHEVE